MKDDLITIEFNCPSCGKTHYLHDISEKDFNRFIHRRETGEHIQDIFPDMPRNDREKFLTSFCDSCQRKIFGDSL